MTKEQDKRLLYFIETKEPMHNMLFLGISLDTLAMNMRDLSVVERVLLDPNEQEYYSQEELEQFDREREALESVIASHKGSIKRELRNLSPSAVKEYLELRMEENKENLSKNTMRPWYSPEEFSKLSVEQIDKSVEKGALMAERKAIETTQFLAKNLQRTHE